LRRRDCCLALYAKLPGLCLLPHVLCCRFVWVSLTSRPSGASWASQQQTWTDLSCHLAWELTQSE
jgi:hypothetical protein